NSLTSPGRRPALLRSVPAGKATAPPAARVLPSGLNATARTLANCATRVARVLPVATSHSLTVASQLPEARVLPSGLNATELTRSVGPVGVAVLASGGCGFGPDLPGSFAGGSVGLSVETGSFFGGSVRPAPAPRPSVRSRSSPPSLSAGRPFATS